MLFFLMDTDKNHLLPKTFASRIELGGVKNSDAMDEMFRQIQKKQHIDGSSQLLVGHPNLHRVLKDLVKIDASTEGSDLDFSKDLSKILLKHIDECLESRAVWIFVELLEHDNTKSFVLDELKKHSKQIASILKANKDKNKGLLIVS